MVKEIITFLLNPLLNERGQYYGGYSSGAGVGMAPGSEEETREYARFLTDEPSADYGDLIAQYKNLYSGGAGSYDAYQEMQTSKDLERIRNTQAARGLGGRSGVGVSAAAQYMGEAGPRHAMQKADYMGKLMSDYARAVNTGRKGYGLAQTKATSKKGAPIAAGPGAGGGSPFQYIPSNPFGGGGGGSARSGGGSGGSGGSTGSMIPGGSLTNFFQGVGGAGSEGPNWYGPSAFNSKTGQYEQTDPKGLAGNYFQGYSNLTAGSTAKSPWSPTGGVRGY